MLKQGIAKLLETEMDRKDFLKNVGIAAVALTGASAVVKALSQQSVKPVARSAGYGGSAYGGSLKK